MNGLVQSDHPAARRIYDGQGRDLALGLSEAEIRLECVKLVVSHTECFSGHAIGAAEEVASFVMTGRLPWASEAKTPEPVDVKAEAPAADPTSIVLGTEGQIAHDLQCARDYARRSNELLARAVQGMKAAKAAPPPPRPPLSEVARDAIHGRLNVLRAAAADQEQKGALRLETSRDHAEVAESYRQASASNRDVIAILERDLGETSA